jgi:hypothetical protein
VTQTGYGRKTPPTLPPFTGLFSTNRFVFSTPQEEAQSKGNSRQATADSSELRRVAERDWPDWLRLCGPRTFTGSFADFHQAFWGWFWPLLWKRKHGEPLTDAEQVFLAIWARGQGKSSHVEWAAIAEGAIIQSGYVLYVSGSEDLAEQHVTSIRERLESEEVSRFYPDLANPQIGRHGNQYGWRQNFLRTAGGWAIRPIGLDVGVRGGRVGDLRPTLIILDDVDDHNDSPHVVQKKLETIARSIIPAGTKDTVILGAQNLIHRNSVFNQILTRKTTVLGRRRVSGPYPAFKDLEIELRQTDDGPRNVIIAGSPTWPDIDKDACQKFLDDSGREAFLAEYQHDFSAIEQGRVLPEYDELTHVISWSQFQRLFGVRYVPQHWERECGHDVGFTKGHQSAWTWIATSAANSARPGLRFRYRGLTFTEPLLDDMAQAVIRVMKPDLKLGRDFDERPLIQRWRVSHEAKSERDTYNAKYDLPFARCKSLKTDGISQWRHYLRVDKKTPHPFREDELLEDGTYRFGCPGWFDVVDDDQVVTPRDDWGLMTHRRQTVEWRWKPTPLTDAGIVKDEPIKADEDSCDSTRMITAEWGPMARELTEAERLEQSLPAPLRRASLDEKAPGFGRDIAEFMRDVKISEHKRQKREEGGNWTSEIIDTNDDPWLGAYKDPEW